MHRRFMGGEGAFKSLGVRPLPACIAWCLGEREIAYSLPDESRDASAATSSWALATDGASPPRLLARLAYSPTYVR